MERRRLGSGILRGTMLLALMALLAAGGWCISHRPSGTPNKVNPPATTESRPSLPEETPAEEAYFVEARQRMVEEQLRGRDINSPEILEVMGRIHRQRFVPKVIGSLAYEDRPLPIGEGQTISQPYIVALMTQLAQPTPQSRALEIGTGSGYQAAVLAELCGHVFSIEIVEPLAEGARKRLAALGYKNLTVRCGDGYQGWREEAPFDVILVTAAPERVPPALVEQLAVGGRLVIPVGRYFQHLLLIEKQPDGSTRRTEVAPVMFVPMTGEVREEER